MMKFLKLVVSILLKLMLRISEQVRCSLYRRLYSIREQLVSLLAQDECKQSKTLQTLVVDGFYSGEKGLVVNDTVSLLL